MVSSNQIGKHPARRTPLIHRMNSARRGMIHPTGDRFVLYVRLLALETTGITDIRLEFGAEFAEIVPLSRDTRPSLGAKPHGSVSRKFRDAK